MKDFDYNEIIGLKQETNIKHRKLKKLFGFKFRYIPELDHYEFQSAYFFVNYSPRPMEVSIHRLKIYIPFMRHDHGISIGRDTISKITYDEDFKNSEQKILSQVRITLF